MENSTSKLDKPSKLTAEQVLEDLRNPIFSNPPRNLIDNNKEDSQWINSNNLLVYRENMVDLSKKFAEVKQELSRLDEELQLCTSEMKEKLTECQR